MGMLTGRLWLITETPPSSPPHVDKPRPRRTEQHAQSRVRDRLVVQRAQVGPRVGRTGLAAAEALLAAEVERQSGFERYFRVRRGTLPCRRSDRNDRARAASR